MFIPQVQEKGSSQTVRIYNHGTFLVFRKKDLYLAITQKLIFKKFGAFHVKSTCKPYKSNNSRRTLQFYVVQWEGYVSGFHEIRRISKDQQLPGMVRPMLLFIHSYVIIICINLPL